MGFLKRQQKPVASLQFVDNNNEARKSRHWNSDDTVEGTAYFRIPAHTRCTRAAVTLRGDITTRTKESPQGSMQPIWSVNGFTFLSVGRQPRTETFVDGLVDVPFRFDLQECARHSTLDPPLSPTLDSRAEAHDNRTFRRQDGGVLYDITYTIVASAFSDRGLITSTKEKISLMPVGQPEPPSYGSLEVAGECFTARTRIPRSRLSLSRRDPVIVDVAAQEPAPLVLRSQSGGSDPSTNLSLLVKISPESSRAISSLPQQAQVQTQMVSRTRVTPNHGKTSDGKLRPVFDHDTIALRSRGNTQNCTLAISNWERYHPGDEVPGFAMTKLSFLYRHPENERLCPSFSTPLLSRDYMLEVKLSFPDDTGDSLKLSVPVRIVYEGSTLDVVADAALERKTSTQTWMREIPQSITA